MSDERTDLQQLTRYALEGRVVTMDVSFSVVERGIVYIDGGRIAAITPTGAPAPPGFQEAPVISTRGTIYPGLIDLHNHLSYDALTLWRVPQLYTNRDQWGRHPDYRKIISGPMTVLGVYDEQYVEGARVAQTARLVGVTLGGIAAVAACTLRQRRERQTALLV